MSLPLPLLLRPHHPLLLHLRQLTPSHNLVLTPSTRLYFSSSNFSSPSLQLQASSLPLTSPAVRRSPPVKNNIMTKALLPFMDDATPLRAHSGSVGARSQSIQISPEQKGRYIGAIDQGTTSTRFIIFDEKGTLIASHQTELRAIHKHSG